MSNLVLEYLQNSFLKDLLIDKEITDISFNGQDLYYVHNLYGRKKADIRISIDQAKDFLRQIANMAMKQFSFQNPILDLSIEKYRINAVHHSIGRYLYQPVVTFSIRIGKDTPIINENSEMLNEEIISLFNVLLKSRVSIVIGGPTSSGKTELQKYLLSSMEENTRVIIIDNVLELNNFGNDHLDINTWQIDERFISSSIQTMVKNALRNNPDWLIVAESRGKEMLEVFNSVLTGVPIITTLHALDIDNMPNRIASMILMNERKFQIESLLGDIYHHLPIYIYLSKQEDEEGKIHRYIDYIGEVNERGQMTLIYDRYKNKYGVISERLLSKLNYQKDEIFKRTFIKKER